MRKLLCISIFILNTYTNLKAQSPEKWNIKPTKEELEYRATLPHQKQASLVAQKSTSVTTMPSDARFPGEFEESKAVAIAWPYDVSGIDVSTNSPYAILWADMANAIQKECPVWIRVENDNDADKVKQFMSNRSTPLTNYKFYLMPGDAFWSRDFGPLGFYYSNNDDLGFMDINYYPGRDNDDKFPELLANELGITNVRSNLYAEGGNYMTDGFGCTFYSDRIHEVNMSNNPLHTSWTLQQVKDSINYAWATNNNIIPTPSLQCDGGTGHIDMYLKMMDEETIAVMEYPSIVTAQDQSIINGVINMISQKNSLYNRPYRIFKLSMPTTDAGATLTDCGDINNDARTYVNGLTVNKTYLMPVFSDNIDGNKAGDNAAIEAMKKVIPGYNIVPLDSRVLTVGGGAVHCVTMQIPADNPIRFWHPSVVDFQPLQDKYHIVAKITNKSGIATAECNWRPKGSSNWQTVTLTDSSGYWVGDIALPGLYKFLTTSGIEYYLNAKSNNGKTMTKPIVAPTGGYYLFYSSWPSSIPNPERNFVLNPLPNPSTGLFYIPISTEMPMHIEAVITDMVGKKINTVNFEQRNAGVDKLNFDLSNLSSGMYFIQISADGFLLGTKKVMKQ